MCVNEKAAGSIGHSCVHSGKVESRNKIDWVEKIVRSDCSKHERKAIVVSNHSIPIIAVAQWRQKTELEVAELKISRFLRYGSDQDWQE